MSLHSFFAPKSVAVIGASSVAGKSGHLIVKNLVELSYPGAVYPINPKAETILGLPAYSSIDACPHVPDTAVIALNREFVPDALERLGRKGVKNVIIASGGFADTGDELGLRLDKEIKEIARRHGIRYMGPNSIGTIDAHSRFITSITPNDPLPVGSASILGQSGLFASGYSKWISDTEPFGVAKIACLGNKEDIDETAMLNYLADDKDTGVIGMYLEGVNDGRAFLAAAQHAARRKPLIVLKGGASELGGKAAAGHTGSLAGDEAVYRGVLRQVGAIHAGNLNELFAFVAGFEHGPLPRGNRLGVLSITGAGCVLAADAAERHGLELPTLQPATIARIRRICPDWAPIRNPVDIWSSIEKSGVEASYREIGLAVAADPQVDMVLLAITLFEGTIFDIEATVRAIKIEAPDKTVATALFGGAAEDNRAWTALAHRGGAATFTSLDLAVETMAHMYDFFRQHQ